MRTREPTILAAIVSPLFAYALSLGVPAREIELSTGVLRSHLVNPENRIPETNLNILWDQVQSARPNKAVVIDYVKRAPLASIAGLAYSARYAGTVRQVFELIIRNQAFAAEGCHLALVEEDEDAIFLSSSCLGNPMELATICLLGICWRTLNEVLELDLRAKRIDIFGYPRGCPSTYEHFFGAPVEFGANRNALIIDRAVLDRQSKHRNDELYHFSQVFLQMNAGIDETQAEQTDFKQLLESVEAVVSKGEFSSSAVADDLGVSRRTAQRIAARHGTTLGNLVREARFSHIERMLLDEKVLFAELAYLSGYSDDRAFRRAFKSKFGMTPSDYRSSRLSHSKSFGLNSTSN